MMTTSDVDTPAARRPGMQANVALMEQRMNALGVKFRPHVKTTPGGTTLLGYGHEA